MDIEERSCHHRMDPPICLLIRSSVSHFVSTDDVNLSRSGDKEAQEWALASLKTVGFMCWMVSALWDSQGEEALYEINKVVENT